MSDHYTVYVYYTSQTRNLTILFKVNGQREVDPEIASGVMDKYLDYLDRMVYFG